MKLSGFHIDGFGIFHHQSVENLSPNLSLFLGRNEAGKSTLLAFIRAMLFGFPDGRSHENAYPPMAGGRYGGRVFLVTEKGDPYSVNRLEGPRGGRVEVLKPDQTRGGKATLAGLLGTANRTLYKNIYAFGLSELQTFETLNTDAIRETLSSAGAGIDPLALTRLKQKLEKDVGERFKVSGSKPQINQILSRLLAIGNEKKALSHSIEEFDRLKAGMVELTQRILTLEDKRRASSLRVKEREHLIQAWPDWIRFTAARERQAQIREIPYFPAQGIERFEGLKGRLEEAKQTMEAKREDVERLEAELAGLEIDAPLLAQRDAVLEIQKEEGHFEAALQEYDLIRGEIEHSRGSLSENMKRLGPLWTEKKVLLFPLSIATGEEVRRFRDLLHRAEMEVEGKRERLAGIVAAEKEQKKRLNELHETLPADQEELKRKKRACGEMRELLFRAGALNREWAHCEERLRDSEEEQALWEEKEETEIWTPWVARLIGGAGAAAFVGFAFSRHLYWALASGGLWLIALVVALLRRWVEKREETISKRKREIRSPLVARVNRLLDLKENLKVEVDDNEKSLSRVREILSLEIDPTAAVLEKMEEALAERISTFERRREWERDLNRTEKKVAADQEDLREAEKKWDTVQLDWQEWLKGRGLDPTLSPEGALESLATIQSCRNQLDHLVRLEAKETSLKEIVDDYGHLLSRTYLAWQGREIEGEDVQGSARRLISAFGKAEGGARKQAVLTEEITRGQGALERQQRQAEAIQGEIDSLFRSGQAENEEQFRQRALEYAKGINLRKELEQAEARLRELSFVSGSLDRIGEYFSGTSPEKLEEERMRNDKKLKETEEDLDRLKKEQATLEEQVRQLSQDDRIALLRAEEETLKASLEVVIEEWIVAALALRLIRMARSRYEKERQPAVIREAGRYFSHITEGAYPLIFAPLGDHQVDVVHKQGSRRDAAQLSRGTVEQLYLSLRFGFIGEFTRRSEPLPIMMDEILVNFDPGRGKETVRAIVELSQSHQILYFTCHPETVHRFKDEDPKIPVFEIENGVIRGRHGGSSQPL
jgi:uncharacterized protein YhaN